MMVFSFCRTNYVSILFLVYIFFLAMWITTTAGTIQQGECWYEKTWTDFYHNLDWYARCQKVVSFGKKKNASKTFGKHVREEDGTHGAKNFDGEKHSSYLVGSKFFDTDPLSSSTPIMCGFPDLPVRGCSLFEQAKKEESLCGWIGGSLHQGPSLTHRQCLPFL